MSFQWLELRINEEQERRHREAEILERLPRSLEEVHRAVTGCVESYQRAFGPEAAIIHSRGPKIEVAVRDNESGRWQERARVTIALVPELPGLRIEQGGAANGDAALMIEVGLLPGEKVYYRAGEQFLTMEELTRRILDRALFPKLKQE